MLVRRIGLPNYKKISVYNARRLLEWYEEPPEVEVKEKMWHCYVCDKASPESVEGYTKFEFHYCTLDCLGVHRKNKFKVKA